MGVLHWSGIGANITGLIGICFVGVGIWEIKKIRERQEEEKKCKTILDFQKHDLFNKVIGSNTANI